MLTSLFKPKEVKATLQALHDLKSAFTAGQDPFADIAVKLIFGEAQQMITRQAGDTVVSIRDQKWSPRDLALLILSKRAFAQAASGAHHVYRGTPDQTGQAIKVMFIKAGKMMVESGFIQSSEQQADERDLEKAMREVG